MHNVTLRCIKRIGCDCVCPGWDDCAGCSRVAHGYWDQTLPTNNHNSCLPVSFDYRTEPLVHYNLSMKNCWCFFPFCDLDPGATFCPTRIRIRNANMPGKLRVIQVYLPIGYPQFFVILLRFPPFSLLSKKFTPQSNNEK